MKRVNRFFFHNFGWKLASLTFSVLLWFAVVGEPELMTVQSAEVYYAGLSPQLVLLTDPDEVQLELRGPSALLNRENLSRVKVLLDLTSVRMPGEQTFGISADDVTLPPGVSLLSAVPSRLVLNFDRRATKNVTVQPVLRGTPATGYVVASHTVTPASIVISGPEHRLAAIDSVQTSEIDISGAAADLEVRANAYVSDGLVQMISPAAVVVRIRIEKGLEQQNQ